METRDRNYRSIPPEREYRVRLVEAPSETSALANGKDVATVSGNSPTLPLAAVHHPVVLYGSVVGNDEHPDVTINPIEIEPEITQLIWLYVSVAFSAVVGWWIRSAESTQQGKLQRSERLREIATAIIGGMLFYLFGTNVATISSKYAFIRDYSSYFQALFWGFFGGYSGSRGVRWIISFLDLNKSNQRATAD